MTVNKLSDRRVLVILYENDMINFDIDTQGVLSDEIFPQKSIMKITRIACVKFGIDTRGKKICVEALSFEKECYLLLTFKTSLRRSYRLKGSVDCRCYKLPDSESFLSAVELMYRENIYCPRNSAYFYDGNYYIIFDYPAVPLKLRRILSEFGEKHGGRLRAAVIRENGTSVCRRNAIWQIGKSLV